MITFPKSALVVAFAVALLASACPARAADDLEVGNLTVDNNLTIEGEGVFTGFVGIFSDQFIGRYLSVWGAAENGGFPELSINTTNITGGDPTTVNFYTYNLDRFQWGLGVDNTPAQIQMSLEPNAILNLYNSGGNLSFDPGNQTLFFEENVSLTGNAGKLLITGTSGNLAFNPNASTLVINGTTTLDLTNLGAGGSYVSLPVDAGFAPGNLAVANGVRSAAFGGGANATGNFSVALSGGNVGANGTAALAVGTGSYANSTAAIALGNGTTAQAWSSTTLGHYNSAITGNNTAWAPTDPAFIVGIGNSTHADNGLVILNNGNTTIKGDAAVGGNTSVTGNLSVTGNASVGGNTTTMTLGGNIFLSKSQGDIPMGSYGN